MTKQEAISAVYEGKIVSCTKEEYELEIRDTLQDYAGRWIDTGQGSRAIIAQMEVKRLDAIFAE